MDKKVFKHSCLGTETIFNADGHVDIIPDTKGKKNIVKNGKQVVQKGKMLTLDDGTSHFQPYAKGTGRRYRVLWVDPYGSLKLSKTRLVLTVSVPLDIDDPIGWLESTAESCKPTNTDGHVLENIDEAIDNLKNQ